MDFVDAKPRWRKVGDILQPLSTTKAVLLPDGKVLIGQGVNRSSGCRVDGRPCTFEEREGHHFQMFDPDTGGITKLGKTTVSRGLHGTATLLPDASVFFAGENREALVRPDDPSFPLMSSYAGLLPRGDPDQGVPVGQVFSPPYLFKQDGSRAARPVIKKAPDKISYRGHFDVEVAGDARDIASVVLLRSDHNTHSLTTGDRYVKLAFREKEDDELRVRAPKLPAQAVPGIYMLFVVDRNGVPSLGRRVDIKPETRGRN
jgi:galactose oxidase